MATIGKIRNNRGLLIVLIGLGMLGFLIPYDAVLALMGQGGNRAVGEIDGQSLSAVTYQGALQERDELFDYTNTQSLENEVWNDLIEQTLLEDQYSKLGLDVGQDEFDEIRFGENLSPYVKRTFYQQGETAEKKEIWRQNFSGMFNDPVRRRVYEGYAKVIVAKRKREKYDNLIKKGVYSNTLEAKYDYLATQEKVNIKYVLKKFAEIPDSAVDVSASDVRAYYNAHMNDDEYKQQAGRNIEFIVFKIEPSQKDIEELQTTMNSLVEQWNNSSNDSTFVLQNSTNGLFNTLQVRTKVAIEDTLNAMFMTADVGTIVGPYEENGAIKVAKIIRRGMQPDTSASVRHILLKSNSGTEEEMAQLMARADSLTKRYKAGDDWDDLVTRFSDDPGSKATGGKYENFPKGQMVKPFEEYSFNNAPGSIGAVETTFGVHLIEVLDQNFQTEEATVAFIERAVAPSSLTRREIYKTASDFSINFNKFELFKDAADTSGYSVVEANNIKRNAQSLPGGLKDPFEIINWAYTAAKNEVSNPLQTADSYVVAALKKIMEPGVPPFENVEQEMKDAATKEAKAKKYKGIMDEGNTLEEIASLVETTVKTARNISLKTGTIAGSGTSLPEPEVVGLAMGIEAGRMSKPIVGENGIWVIAPDGARIEAEAKDSFFEDQDKLLTRTRNAAAGRNFTAMKEAAKVKDLRLDF
jgi:peptidyl-prolyl cis-trans isomerase D